MRRLPIYFLIDVSESMAGQPLQEVEVGLATIVGELKRDPHALETAHLSIIAFAGKAKTLTPLTDLIRFYPPKINIGIGTSLGKGLSYLSASLSKDIQLTSPDRKGDWRPLVFLFTDGLPTDAYEPAIEDWKKGWGKRVSLVCVAFGGQVDLSILQRLSEHVLVFNPENPAAYSAFFKWVSASIRVSSQSLAGGQGDFNLAPRDEQILSDVPGASSFHMKGIDQRVATFLARCSGDKKPYLIKYKEVSHASYRLEGTFLFGADFDELTEPGTERSNATVNTEWLSGSPHCPACGNTHGLVKCSCGGILCAGEELEPVTCPWCNKQMRLSGEGGSHFDLNRTKG